MKDQPFNQEFFNKIASDFDTHVKQSIPLFSLFQQNVVANLAQHFYGKSILDVCGSTGELGRQLLFGGWDGKYECLDGSPQMLDVFNAVTPEGSKNALKFTMEGFMMGWEDDYLGNNVEIPAFLPSLPEYSGGHKYDLAVEILGFQFFTKERLDTILAMKKLAPVCIFFQKFNDVKAQNAWNNNEWLKNTIHKPKFFSAEEIANKQEVVLNDMGDYCYDSREFSGLLYRNFNHVQRIAKIGNFSGYIASDKPVDWDLNQMLLCNDFTTCGTF